MDEINRHAASSSGIDELTESLVGHDERKRNRPRKWVCMDTTAIAICWDILLKNSMSHSCRAIKQAYLFKAPLRYSVRDGKPLRLLQEAQDEIERHYIKFARDFLDCLLVQGVVPFTLVQLPSGHFVPRVPDPGTYVIQMAYVTETESRYYRVWRQTIHSTLHGGDRSGFGSIFSSAQNREPGGRAFSGMGGSISESLGYYPCMSFSSTSANWYYDKNVYVIDGLGRDPHITGSLNSAISSVIPDIIFTNTLCDNLMQAEFRLLNPYYLIQNHKNVDEGSRPGMVREMHMPVYTSDDMMRTAKDTKMTDMQLAAFNQQLIHISNAARGNTSSEANRSDERLEFDRFARIPRGFEYAHASTGEHHVGGSYAAQRAALDETVARLHGLSVAQLKPEGSQRGFLDAFRDNFRNNLCELAVMLGDHMSYIFNQIYSEDAASLAHALVYRKPVVDTSHFTDLPSDRNRLQSEKVAVSANINLAPPDIGAGMFEEKVSIRPPTTVPTRQEHRNAINALKRKNAEFKRAVADSGPSDVDGKSTRMKRPTRGMFIITIPVDIHADAKLVKHAFDMGAYSLEEYQQYLRFKMGIGRIPLTEDASFMDEVVESAMRTTGSDPPRADSVKPETEDLGALGSTYKRSLRPSLGVLAEAVRRDRLSVETAKEVLMQEGQKSKEQEASPKKPKKKKAKKEEEEEGKDSE